MRSKRMAEVRCYFTAWRSASTRMGSTQSRPREEQASVDVPVEEERGFYGQRVSSMEAPAPPPSSSYDLFTNTLTANVPEEHVGRLMLYMAIFGALFATIGLVGLVFPFVFALAVEQVMGTLLVVGGVFSGIQYGIMYDMPGNGSFLLMGFLHLGFGLWMLLQPIQAGYMLMFVLSGWLLGHGLLKTLMACQVRTLSSWAFVLLSGIVSVLLAVLILVLAPTFGVVLLGIIFGADFFVSGLSMFVIAATTYCSRRSPSTMHTTEPLLAPAAVP